VRPSLEETIELAISDDLDAHAPRADAGCTLAFAEDREQRLHLCPVLDVLALGPGELRLIRDGGADDEMSPTQRDAIDAQLVTGTDGLVAHEVTSASDDLEIALSPL